MTLEERVKALEEKSGKLHFPIDSISQGAVENVLFKVLQAQKVKVGLPIYTVARIDKPMQAEMYIYNITGSPKIVSYINGVEYKWTSD